MQKYETTMIIDPMLDQSKVEAVVKKYEEIIKSDGEILEIQKWGKKRLAYTINKKPTGFYVHYKYSAAPSIPAKLERDFNLSTTIMRFLTIATDPRAEKQIAKLAEAKKEA